MAAGIDLARLISDVIAEVQPTADSRGVLVRTTSLASLPARVTTDADALRRTVHQGLDFTLQALTSGVVEVSIVAGNEAEAVWTLQIGATAADGRLVASCSAQLALRADSVEPQRSLRVLIVDDSALQRSLMRTYLEGSPHTLVDVDGGDQALHELRARPCDVAFVDMQMPGMNGRATIAAIRDLEVSLQRPPAVIVALTSLSANDDATEAIDAGADECIAKPLSQGAFLHALTLEPVVPSDVAPEKAPTQPAPAPSAPNASVTAATVPTPPPTPVDTPLGAVPSSQLLVVARHQLGSILGGPETAQLERLRTLSHGLVTSAHAQGFQDVATLAGALSHTAQTGSLRDAVIAARTLQAWIVHVEQQSQS